MSNEGTNSDNIKIDNTKADNTKADNTKADNISSDNAYKSNCTKGVEGSTIPKLKFKNIIGHFRTIMHHKKIVRHNCFKMGLYRQGMLHDMSKLSPVEFWTGCRYYQGNRSPNAKERETIGYSLAWLHHKGRNKHHYEYWVDFSSRNSSAAYGLMPAKMPDVFIAEMIADRVAACMTYGGKNYKKTDPLKYLLMSTCELPMHPYTREKLEFFLRMIADKGEEETFRYIRKEFLHR